MRRLRPRRPRSRFGPRQDDAGLTLPELTVALFITSLLMAAIGGVMMSSLRADRVLRTTSESASILRVATESMSRALRTATVPAGESSALVTATPTALTFYTLANHTGSGTTPLPTRVEYYWDSTAGCLREARTPARTLASPGPGGSLYAWDTGRSNSCLVRTRIAPSLSSPWFTYYTNGTTSTAIPTTSGLTLSERQTVRSVAVSIRVAPASSPDVNGVSASIRVNLANVVLAQGGDA